MSIEALSLCTVYAQSETFQSFRALLDMSKAMCMRHATAREHTNIRTRTHEHTNTQTHKHTNTSWRTECVMAHTRTHQHYALSLCTICALSEIFALFGALVNVTKVMYVIHAAAHE